MPPVPGLIGWRTSANILTCKGDVWLVRVHGWDLSKGPVEVPIAAFDHMISQIGDDGKFVCWVEEQPDGTLKLSDFTLPYESPC